MCINFKKKIQVGKRKMLQHNTLWKYQNICTWLSKRLFYVFRNTYTSAEHLISKVIVSRYMYSTDYLSENVLLSMFNFPLVNSQKCLKLAAHIKVGLFPFVVLLCFGEISELSWLWRYMRTIHVRAYDYPQRSQSHTQLVFPLPLKVASHTQSILPLTPTPTDLSPTQCVPPPTNNMTFQLKSINFTTKIQNILLPTAKCSYTYEWTQTKCHKNNFCNSLLVSFL